MNSQTVNAALKRAELGGILVSQGLQSIASTALNEQGFSPDVIRAALAHVDKNEVRRAYKRPFMSQLCVDQTPCFMFKPHPNHSE